MTTFGCDEFRDTAPDLALGLLTGDERGAAIRHVATCGSCRHYLDGLVEVSDDLLLLTPAIEPEIGFESRVMARLASVGAFSPPAGGPPPTRAVRPRAGRRPDSSRRPWARARTWAIAAVVVVVAGVTGLTAGLARGRDAGRTAALSEGLRSANQLAARTVVVWADQGKSWCQLVAFPGHGSAPAQLVIQLDEPGEPPGSYQVMAEPTDGHPAVLIGTIDVAGGHGMLTADIPAGTGPVGAIRVIDANTVRYRATFLPV